MCLALLLIAETASIRHHACLFCMSAGESKFRFS
ncbi:hypothetical protein LEMLEM_LOCUS8253 [Lemmus lemmus]